MKLVLYKDYDRVAFHFDDMQSAIEFAEVALNKCVGKIEVHLLNDEAEEELDNQE